MSTEKPFTKRQIQIIVKIAFLEAMLIVFTLPSIQSTGEVSSIQHNTTSISCNIASGGTSCTKVITFSPSFTSKPRFILSPNHFAGNTPLSNIILPIESANSIITFTTGSTNWLGMPGFDSPTELYGLTSNEVQFDFPSFPTGTDVYVFCISGITVASGNSTATLGIQSSPDSITWTDVGTSAFRINIGTTSSTIRCVSQAISTAARQNLRIVGRDGLGGADNPTFGTISLFTPTRNVPFTVPDIPSMTYSLLATTGFTFACTASLPENNVVGCFFDWTASIP